MLSTNPGFQSRIQFTLDFPNYSRDELRRITELMLKNRHYSIGDAALNRILDITDLKRKEANFANAREIRNILDQVIMCQNLRIGGGENRELGLADVNKYIQDAKINLPASGDGTDKKIMTGEEELDRLVGLSSVKRMIKKIRAYAKKNASDGSFNLHMCFLGNPGTGKTEVARILSRIFYDAGVLPEAKLIETDSTGLLGQYVGETGPKTQRIVQSAMGGVLFIDEAYALTGKTTGGRAPAGYGDEAIAVLLKEMEDYRGQFCVILAGYKEEMNNLLGANPGLKSRIQFALDFPDYSREELSEIAQAFLAGKKYTIFPFEKDQIITLRRLEKLGVTEEDINAYCEAVRDFTEEDSYFTLPSLRQDGFSHTLDQLGFEDYFYASLLGASEGFSSQHAYGSIVLYHWERKGQFSRADFLVSQLREYESVDPDEFIEDVRDRFGVSIPSRYEVTQAVQGSELYYDPIMDKVYRDKELYYSDFDE